MILQHSIHSIRYLQIFTKIFVCFVLTNNYTKLLTKLLNSAKTITRIDKIMVRDIMIINKKKGLVVWYLFIYGLFLDLLMYDMVDGY